ncbi:uncharacterized protein LOC142349410 [Convolutriloba macropyga]|uniref:uncharacterized protein LOC142349410 n=1 Tax=Convolutriloba macropyga TaxID=536237 RepID=UPI003F526C3E
MTDPYSSATLQPNTANLKAEELTEDQIADAFADFVTKESTFKKPKDPKKDLKIVNFSQQCYLKYTLSSYVETRYVDERRETEYSPAQLMATESSNFGSDSRREAGDDGGGLVEGETRCPFGGQTVPIREGDSTSGGSVAAHYRSLGPLRHESDENATFSGDSQHHAFNDVSSDFNDKPEPQKNDQQRAMTSSVATPGQSTVSSNPIMKDLWVYDLRPADEWWKGTKEILLEKRQEQNERGVTTISKFVVAEYKTKTDFKFTGDKETPITEKKIEDITGLPVYDSTSPFPIGQIPQFSEFPSFNDAVTKILKDHYNKYQMKNKDSKRVRVQKHSVMSVPVATVDLKYKGKQMKAWVYGNERKVQCPDMKGCCVM